MFERFGAWVYGQLQRGAAQQLEAYADVLWDRVVEVTIRRGRSSPNDLPAPATVTALVMPEQTPQPGDRFDVYLRSTLTDYVAAPAGEGVGVRFAGEISEVAVTASADPVLGPATLDGGPLELPLYRITAVDQRARVNRWTGGDEPWPAEPVNQRIGRILNSALNDLPWDLPEDPVRVLARDVDNQSHGGLLDELATWTGGVLTLSRTLRWRWFPLNQRGGEGVDVYLAADQVAGPLEWTSSEGDKVTRARVTYGPEGEGGQPVVEVVNEQSEVYGSEGRSADRRPVNLTTQLEGEADARWVANELVARRSLPQWRVSQLVVPLDKLLARGRPEDVDAVRQLITAKDEFLIRLRGFPDVARVRGDEPGPRSNGYLWCVGTTETMSAFEWTITLDVAPYEVLADPITWEEVDPFLTWETAPAELTWFSATTWQPIALDVETWRDVPSTLRWSAVPDDVTWATADSIHNPAP